MKIMVKCSLALQRKLNSVDFGLFKLFQKSCHVFFDTVGKSKHFFVARLKLF